MRQTVPQRWAYCVAAALSLSAIPNAVQAADYYLANKSGSGSGTKDDPFGLADVPKPDNKPTRPLTILQPGDTLWFKGGEYAFHTGPVKEFYYKGYLRPVRSGEPGKPISFRACPGEKHLAYMDYNVYTAPPKYTFGAYSQGWGQTFGMDEMRSRGFEQHSQVVAGAGEVFKDERSWDLLSQWRTAGRDGDAVGPENVALVLDITRYGPAGRTATAAAADVKVYRDLAYAKPENPLQTLDVYAPADGQRLAVVVWIHGGGWHRGDKADVDRKPQAFVDRGFVFVSINYRLFPDVTIKQIAEDVSKAIRWAHDHAQDYRGDPDRIIVMGHSAGAQLAALVCTDDRNHTTINADLGLSDDRATREMFAFLDAVLKSRRR